MKRLAIVAPVIGGFLFLWPMLAIHAAGKPGPAVPANQQNAFQLGYALQSPTAQTEEFLQSVKGLRTITNDIQGTSEVGKLAKQSEALRASEHRACGQAARMLHGLNAPSDLQTWMDETAARLSAPLVLSKEASGYLDSDPNTALVMGTIDEAQDIKTTRDRYMPALIAWLKLTQGGDAVWATALGELEAEMHAAVTADRGLSLSRSDPMRLRNSAPGGTPEKVIEALASLAPAGGNLAPLVRLPAILIPPKDMREPQTTLMDVYAAGPLAKSIEKGP